MSADVAPPLPAVLSRECPSCGRRVAPDVSRCPACGKYGLRASELEPERVPFKMRRPASPMVSPWGFRSPGQSLDAWLANVRARAAMRPDDDDLHDPDEEDFDDLELDDDDDEREIRLGPDGEPEPPSLRIGRAASGEHFRVPVQAVTETLALIARRGQGKTHTASVFVEEFGRLGLPVVVIDPVGALWGLAKGRDGISPGLDGVTVLGGDHGEEPIALGEARELAAMALDRVDDGPIVLDLSHLRRDDQKGFVRHFLEELFHLKGTHKSPLHIVVDEADLFAPQMPTSDIDRHSLNALEECVRRGRSRGLGMTLITQRTSVLNKNVLTQTECLIVFQVTSPQDRESIDEWIKMHGDEEKRRILLGSLAKLQRGTCWVWSPAWLKCFERVKIRQRRTFDSSATPTVTLG